MKPLKYTPKQKKRASTMMALGTSECEAAEKLVAAGLFREAVVHLYFTCFYISQALLCDKVPTEPSHKSLNSAMHRAYGRRRDFPRRYVELHSQLYTQRTEFDYKTTHTPDPDAIKKQLGILTAYVKYAMRVVPRVEVLDLLRSFFEDSPKQIKDFSFDVYCPKTYSHHTRLTFWQPPFYLDIFGVSNISRYAIGMLARLRVRRHTDYVVGLNSKVNQYKDDHLVMVDIDAVNPALEAALKPIGGILLKSGRGFHFIGKKVLIGVRTWKREMKALLRNPSLKPHVDKNHIEISLRRGYATLRVTSSPVKPTVPYFYKEI
ncbi:MAG TPA: HEPN domain-containing protein [Kiritimatiellia bacterium]|nr:HEPN domain-containing protein [Kiritimatiellia bacterium]